MAFQYYWGHTIYDELPLMTETTLFSDGNDATGETYEKQNQTSFICYFSAPQAIIQSIVQLNGNHRLNGWTVRWHRNHSQPGNCSELTSPDEETYTEEFWYSADGGNTYVPINDWTLIASGNLGVFENFRTLQYEPAVPPEATHVKFRFTERWSVAAVFDSLMEYVGSSASIRTITIDATPVEGGAENPPGGGGGGGGEGGSGEEEIPPIPPIGGDDADECPPMLAETSSCPPMI